MRNYKRRPFIIAAVVILTTEGCVQEVHPPPAGEYLPTIAASAGVSTVTSSDPSPNPGPNPNPNPGPSPGPRICTDCNGKGWIGDGTIRNKCQPCDGKGWLDAQGNPIEPPMGYVQVDIEDLKKKLDEHILTTEDIVVRLEGIEAKLTANVGDAELDDLVELQEKQHYQEILDAYLWWAIVRKQAILLIVTDVKTKEQQQEILDALETVEDIHERFLVTMVTPKQKWDETSTVAERFELPIKGTNAVIIGPDREYARVTSWEHLK